MFYPGLETNGETNGETNVAFFRNLHYYYLLKLMVINIDLKLSNPVSIFNNKRFINNEYVRCLQWIIDMD